MAQTVNVIVPVEDRERPLAIIGNITRRKIRRGVFKSVADLEDAIKRYIIKAHNKNSKPFLWTAATASSFEKRAQIPEPSE